MQFSKNGTGVYIAFKSYDTWYIFLDGTGDTRHFFPVEGSLARFHVSDTSPDEAVGEFIGVVRQVRIDVIRQKETGFYETGGIWGGLV